MQQIQICFIPHPIYTKNSPQCMIFQFDSPHSISPQTHDIFSFFIMKNTPNLYQKPQNTIRTQQNDSCFCFKSNKNPANTNSDSKLSNSLNQALKEEALKLSRQIAQKNFRHLKFGNSSSKNSFSGNKTFQTTRQSFQKDHKGEISKNQMKNEEKNCKQKNESEKDEFNMSRITFSVVNRSYEKTVNNTMSSNNTSMTESNLLGSVVSQTKKEGERVRLAKQSGDQSFSSISSINKRSSGMGVRSELGNRKGIKIIGKGAQIEPIKEENEEVEAKKFKFIRVRAKDLPPKPRSAQEDGREEVQKIQTEEMLQSRIEDQEENVTYDYSSIVIDFFNMNPQDFGDVGTNRKIQKIIGPQQDEISGLIYNKTNNKLNALAPLLTPQASSISRQTSFSSIKSYNPIQSISNIKSIFNPSSDSNFLSMSINNNFSECSFESIAKKEIKWPYKGHGGFDGLSCINENQQSEIQAKNQSKQSQDQKGTDRQRYDQH